MEKEEKKKKREEPSIWHKIDDSIKKGEPIDEKQLAFVENFVKKGRNILDKFDEWVLEKKIDMHEHARKLNEVKAYRLATVI